MNSVKQALSNEIKNHFYNHHMMFYFQLPDWSKVFEIFFFAKNFFKIIIKLSYILNFDEKTPSTIEPADLDHPRSISDFF